MRVRLTLQPQEQGGHPLLERETATPHLKDPYKKPWDKLEQSPKEIAPQDLWEGIKFESGVDFGAIFKIESFSMPFFPCP